MHDYMETIADEAYSLLSESFSHIFEEIEASREPERFKKIFESYLMSVPVISFNGSRFDINMAKEYIIRAFVLPHPKEASVIKRGNEFISITTPKFIFLDISMFLAPNYSLSSYLAAMKISEKKGFFPYEYIDNLEKLKETKLPPRKAFYSRLKNSEISEVNYQYCQKIWNELGMKTLEDFLVWYNNNDVGPFLSALMVQKEFYENQFGLDMFKNAKSIPGLTLRILFKSLPSDIYFSLFNKTHSDFHSLLRDQIVGGPSQVFDRHQEMGKTKIRGGKVTGKVVGYDANGLYLHALTQPQPTENGIRRQKDKGYRKEYMGPKYGSMAREWLEWVVFEEKKENKAFKIKHMYNGKEHVLGNRNIRVDGWDGHRAYQFHGCAFHGCECSDKHPYNDKSKEELRAKTQEITDYLRNEVEVEVIEMWECEWKELKQSNSAIREFLKTKSFYFQSAFKPKEKITVETIVEKVRSGKLFGLVQCDISTPDDLKSKFSDLPPIFKTIDISINDIGQHMKDYCEQEGLLKQPRRSLIGSYFGKGIVLATPLLKWYLEHGLVVTDVQQFVEYKPQSCFKDFGDTVTAARREGDRNTDSSILADTYKLLGNSAYGKTLEQLSRHRQIKYVSDATKLVNNPLFRRQETLADDLFEIDMAKRCINWNLPLQIGYFVYQYAKLRMLEFYYDFLLEYVDKSDFQLAQMDTDSMYFSISGPSLESVVVSGKRKEFYSNLHKWFPAESCLGHRDRYIECKMSGGVWEPAPCCQEQKTFDKRTLGLFKLEWSGEGCVALTSKTYICFGGDEEKKKEKVVSKGLSLRLNNLTPAIYLDVLRTKKPGGGINKGIKSIKHKMVSYEQYRAGLPYLYIKRKVGADGISTTPLDI